MTSATATKPTLKDMRQWVETIHAEIYSVWHTAKDKMTASELNHLEGALRIISELLTILEASSAREGKALARVRAKVEVERDKLNLKSSKLIASIIRGAKENHDVVILDDMTRKNTDIKIQVETLNGVLAEIDAATKAKRERKE